MKKVILTTALLITLATGTGAHAVEVVAAGDIATGIDSDRMTSDLVLQIAPDHVLTLGDHAYPDGALAEFMQYYDPTWGRFASITLPAPGNHEYETPGAAGYVGYFGSAFPLSTVVPYQDVVPGWDIYQIDTEMWDAAQYTQLAAFLAANPDSCEIVYGHHPRWSSGGHGDDASKQALWKLLVDNGVELYLSGHDHDYERFTKMDVDGSRLPTGTRQVVVGTGGAGMRPEGATPSAGTSRVLLTGNENWGVLDLELLPDWYSGQFRRATGGKGTVADYFASPCRA
jgi:acid phosphatase type 7